MKIFIHSMAAMAFLACIVAIGFTPAQATMTTPNLKPYAGSSVTPVDCRKKYHCHWIKRGGGRGGVGRQKHCHYCG